MDIAPTVLRFIRKQKLIPPGSTVVMGVSGGVDSIVLTHVIERLRHELSIRLHVAHFNHRLRTSADRDQAFVEQFARRLNLPVHTGCRQGRGLVTASEDDARTWRYDFFKKVMTETRADLLCLAHTQSDVAETVLMRLIRGAGLNGLRGIVPKRVVEGMTVVRPFLQLTRSDIEAYTRTHRLKYRTDETNAQTKYLRNKVRLKLIPLLVKEYNPNIAAALSQLAETSAEDHAFLQHELGQRIKENVVSFKGTVRIKAGFLLRQHPALRRLALRHAFEALTGDLNQLTAAHVLDAEQAVLNQSAPWKMSWPKGVRIHFTQQYLTVAYDH